MEENKRDAPERFPLLRYGETRYTVDDKEGSFLFDEAASSCRVRSDSNVRADVMLSILHQGGKPLWQIR